MRGTATRLDDGKAVDVVNVSFDGKEESEVLHGFSGCVKRNRPMLEDSVVLPARIVTGHGVAGGSSTDSPYPEGTISLQMPFFAALGLDLSGFHPATINVSTRPFAVVIVNPAFHFSGVRWTDLHGPESFDFVHVGLLFRGRRVAAWGYRPTAETKAGHPQPPEVLEVIAPFLPDPSLRGFLSLELDPREVDIERTTPSSLDR